MDLVGRFIIVIETDFTVAEFLTTILQKQGALVYSGPWTDQMLAYVQQNQAQIDAILMNMRHLHNKTGYDVLGELGEQLTRPNIPVIAISGIDRYEAPRIQAAGFAGFIHKPIHPTEFITAVTQIMNQHADLVL